MRYDIYTAYLAFVKSHAEAARIVAKTKRRIAAAETLRRLGEWHGIASRIAAAGGAA